MKKGRQFMLAAFMLSAFPFSTLLGQEFPNNYTVTGISAGGVLNVRSGPGAEFQILAKLKSGASDVEYQGDRVMIGSDEWVFISFSNVRGWVQRKYLTPSVLVSSPVKLQKENGQIPVRRAEEVKPEPAVVEGEYTSKLDPLTTANYRIGAWILDMEPWEEGQLPPLSSYFRPYVPNKATCGFIAAYDKVTKIASLLYADQTIKTVKLGREKTIAHGREWWIYTITPSVKVATALPPSPSASPKTTPKSDLPGTYTEWGTQGLYGDPVVLVTIVLKPDWSFKYDNPWIKEYGSGSYRRVGNALELTFTEARREPGSIGKLTVNQVWEVGLSKNDEGNFVLETHGCNLEKQ